MGSIPYEEPSTQIDTVIYDILEEQIKSNKFLGLSFVAIDRTGNTIYSGAHGHQSFTRELPMTLGTAGWMASMTKVMTSIAAMQVVEKGLVGLDDDLAPLVPEFRDIQILAEFNRETKTSTFTKPTQRITLRRLLSHSSGFAYDQWNENLMAWSVANGKDTDFGCGEWRAWIRPLVSEPGTSWTYSQGIDWAGRVVELLSNQTLEEYMSENIWTRVGMINTTFFPLQHPSIAHLDLGTRANGPNEPLTPGKTPWPIPVQDCMGGCGVYSTAEDYAKMLAALISDREVLLTNKSIDEFFRPQLSEGSQKALAFARSLGVVQIDIPLETPVDHGLGGLIVLDDIPHRRKKGSLCWDGMSNPNWFIDRDSGIACVLFTQILPCPDPATKRLWAKLEETIYGHCIDKRT